MSSFQFHKGAIKTIILIVADFHFGSFNSIKVRLRPVIPITQKVYKDTFQFHKGAIKTCRAAFWV